MPNNVSARFGAFLGHLRSFLQDFLPENNLQMLFPLASLLLYVGASYPWLPPRHVLGYPQFQHQDGTLWFDLSTRFSIVRYYVILSIVHFGFLGSVAVWCLPVRKIWRSFALWVLLPSAFAILSFMTVVVIGRAQPTSVAEPAQQALRENLHEFPSRLMHLGTGFYITLLGVTLFVVTLWIARLPVPVQFYKAAVHRETSAEATELGRRIFAVLIASTAIVDLIELAIFFFSTNMIPPTPQRLPWYDNWPRNFAAFHWLPGVLDGLAVAACAVFVLRGDQRRTEMKGASRIRSCAAIAILLPLSIAMLPRLVLKALFEYSTVLSTVPDEFLGFRAFPWVLVMFVIAALQQFTLRCFLQNRLEKIFGFRRTCLLIGLLWWLFPLGTGFGPIPGLRLAIPGVSVLVSLLLYALYNLPLTWLWSRTRSLGLVSLMHGTILVFRAGDAAYGIYFTFWWLYWLETAAWIFVTFYLFKKFPIVQSGVSFAPASD